MSAYVFLVCHRTVDLVAESALHALRDSLGLGDQLLSLRRDDVFVLEGMDLGADEAWATACSSHAAWFNPNTHRHAFFAAAEGALASAGEASDWPEPWMGALIDSDRSDLAPREESSDLGDWLALPRRDGAFSVSIAAWDSEDPVQELPRGHWPASGARVLPLQLWTLALMAKDAESAQALALEHALTRSRTQGLLIHPHVQRWALAAPVASL